MLDNKPELTDDLVFYVTSFNTLSSRRPYSMSALPIPFQEIVAFLSVYPWYDVDRFIKYIIHLDNTWLSEKGKLDDRKNKSKSPSQSALPKAHRTK